MADEQWIPGNHAELMAAIDREWKLLMDAVQRLHKAGRMTTPDAGDWSPKDNLAHLTDWMNILMGHHLDRRPLHEVTGLPEQVTGSQD